MVLVKEFGAAAKGYRGTEIKSLTLYKKGEKDES